MTGLMGARRILVIGSSMYVSLVLQAPLRKNEVKGRDDDAMVCPHQPCNQLLFTTMISNFYADIIEETACM